MDPKFSPSPSLISGGGSCGDTGGNTPNNNNTTSSSSDCLWDNDDLDVEKILEAEFPSQHEDNPISDTPHDGLLETLNYILKENNNNLITSTISTLNQQRAVHLFVMQQLYFQYIQTLHDFKNYLNQETKNFNADIAKSECPPPSKYATHLPTKLKNQVAQFQLYQNNYAKFMKEHFNISEPPSTNEAFSAVDINTILQMTAPHLLPPHISNNSTNISTNNTTNKTTNNTNSTFIPTPLQSLSSQPPLVQTKLQQLFNLPPTQPQQYPTSSQSPHSPLSSHSSHSSLSSQSAPSPQSSQPSTSHLPSINEVQQRLQQLQDQQHQLHELQQRINQQKFQNQRLINNNNTHPNPPASTTTSITVTTSPTSTFTQISQTTTEPTKNIDLTAPSNSSDATSTPSTSPSVTPHVTPITPIFTTEQTKQTKQTNSQLPSPSQPSPSQQQPSPVPQSPGIQPQPSPTQPSPLQSQPSPQTLKSPEIPATTRCQSPPSVSSPQRVPSPSLDHPMPTVKQLPNPPHQQQQQQQQQQQSSQQKQKPMKFHMVNYKKRPLSELDSSSDGPTLQRSQSLLPSLPPPSSSSSSSDPIHHQIHALNQQLMHDHPPPSSSSSPSSHLTTTVTKLRIYPELLTMKQSDAAKILGISASMLSKRWREAMNGKKWPYRVHRKMQKEMDANDDEEMTPAILATMTDEYIEI